MDSGSASDIRNVGSSTSSSLANLYHLRLDFHRSLVGCLVLVKYILNSDRSAHISGINFKIQGAIIITIDVLLSFYFMRVVRKELIKPGLGKYKPLVFHNFRIVCLSVMIDVS